MVLALIGLIIGYPNGIYVVIAGYIFGFLLPIFLYKKFNAKKVNFPHLVERVSLIIIIAFGEAIVDLANYFNDKTPIIYAILLFASFCMMFTSYVIFSDKIINHHQVTKGFILMTTVATLYLNLKEIKSRFLAWFIIVSIALYYLALFINGVYSKNLCQFSNRKMLY
ncbi:low temperature requirement protein A [Lactobacillus acidophilus]|uniref:low temperature requirement protein A n=1 Tax=Lactobacillus acidophilus TaxID=1579 RepID=UPI001F494ADF|nr:low temperature requirement protein A [Lactobacillus acidophilus]